MTAALGMTTFAELRAHTGFSFGDGAVTPERLVAHAISLGYTALGITDTADLGGIPRFVNAARLSGKLRPVVGAELRVDGRPAAFLVRTVEGYRNLAALVTRARMGAWASWTKIDGQARRGRPNVTWREVAELSAGLHALTGPATGPIAATVRAGDRANARRMLDEWREVFGERLAVEVQLHYTGGAEGALAGALVDLAERRKIPWVVAHDPRYIDNDGRLVHDVLTSLRYSVDVDTATKGGFLHPNGEWRLLSPEEMARRWQGREQGIEESARIADECGDFQLSWMRPPMPKFAVPPGHTDTTFLAERVRIGAKERWGDTRTTAQLEQIEKELGVIDRLGFSGFFLVMWDAVHYAQSRGILCQGRGSAANSVVAYLLGITAVDPVRHGLLFERFLSETRADGKTAEPPDIDVDFEHDRREEVLDYVYEHYDRSKAAITCTVQTYRAPNAILDAMRAFGYPTELAVQFSKRLHYAEPADAVTAMRGGLAKRFELDIDGPRGRALLAAIGAFDGLPRLRSTHVGGFVLSSESLGDYMPIEQTTMGRTIIQFDKDDLDLIGVPKFDFLGLGALSLVRYAFDEIERRTGNRPAMYRLPPDDAKTYDLISRGETIGTFQIESRAQIASILHTRPERLYDIVVQVALIRPGPIQAKFVRPYTRRRRGQEEVFYQHPTLRPILERTQGIPIFQEQAMAVSMALGGFSAAEADELRRTMGHMRKKGRLVAVLEKLEARMIENKVEADIAHQICEDLQSFANYGFPESHAWSFALIAYATAWLKTHHPTEFYLGLLNAWPMGFYSPATLIHDAGRHHVEVRPPCMRDGQRMCTTEETDDPLRPALRVGWRYIRGIGEKALDALEAAWKESRFTSIEDVVRRAGLPRADALHLARAAAFNAWEPDRRKAGWEALRCVSDTLPLAPARPAHHAPRPLDETETIFLDYATTGTSIHGHPMQHLREFLHSRGAKSSADLPSLRGGETIAIAGMVTVRQRPQTANGTLFLLLEDEFGFINIIVPSTLVEDNAEVVKFAPFIVVQGKFERDGQVMNVVGRRFRELRTHEIATKSRDFR
jgi:error-prone DNA polymerase